jgi:Xaa-Pro aminopeptidase
MRPGNTFGQVVEGMRSELLWTGAWNLHPLIQAMYPFGPISGWSTGMPAHPDAAEYGPVLDVHAVGAEIRLRPGMAFSVAPNAVIGDHAVSLGGTVVVGESDPVELNHFTAQLLRAA